MRHQTIVTATAALVTAGALALGGSALARAGTTDGAVALASATTTANPSSTADPGAAAGARGRGQGLGRDLAPGQVKEKLKDLVAAHGIAGDVAVRVTQAATTKEPTAYLLRVWKADDGTFRAHMVRPDGTRIVLVIDKDYAVTSVKDAPAAAGRGPRAGSQPAPTSGSAPTS